MGRNPEIEAILQAWWDFDHSAPPERAKMEEARNQLIAAVLAKSN